MRPASPSAAALPRVAARPATSKATIRERLARRSGLLPPAAATALAAGLRLSSLGASSNPYYDAAVRSMGLSWHNFFYAAFDPAARLAIDKPPLDLWFQVASVKLFGFSHTALLLPQALAGTLAVPLLYDLVKRGFGRWAGLAAALALAVLPLSVLTSRSDTMDSLMMALSVLAAWLVVRAAETGRLRYLLAGAAVAGLNFDVKLFEALLAVPALAVLYLVATRDRHRLRRLVAAGLVFAACALAWPVAVSLTPASERPFAIGSRTGSVWDAMFVFNGTERVSPRDASTARTANRASARGLTRLFDPNGLKFGRNVGLELVPGLLFSALALGGAAAGAPAVLRRPAGRIKLGIGAAIAVWLAICFVVFSEMRGLPHTRYLEAISPAVAAALGIGLAASVRLAVRRVTFLVLFGMALTLTVLYASSAAGSNPAVTEAAVAAAVGVLAAVIARRAGAAAIGVAAACTVFAALVVPAARSVALVHRGESDAGIGARGDPKQVQRVENYVHRRAAGVRYEVIIPSYSRAAPYIAAYPRPVLVLTTVKKRPAVRVPELAALARAHQVKFALLDGRCARARPTHLAGCPKTSIWIRRHSIDISRRAGFPSGACTQVHGGR